MLESGETEFFSPQIDEIQKRENLRAGLFSRSAVGEILWSIFEMFLHEVRQDGSSQRGATEELQ